jgi:hypothetical protein
MRRFLAPMWVAILSPALLKERPGRFTFVAIPLCLLGVYLIAEAKTGDLSTHHVRTIGIIVAIFQVGEGLPWSAVTRCAAVQCDQHHGNTAVRFPVGQGHCCSCTFPSH